MFEKLVVSTSERRKYRTARFFAGTSLVYLTTIASMLALSVVVASPRLANDRPGGLPQPITWPVFQPSQKGGGSGSQHQAQPDLRRFVDYNDLTRGPQETTRQAAPLRPPGVGDSFRVGIDQGPGIGDGPGFGFASLVPGNGQMRIAYAPPPEPAKPKPEPEKKTVSLPSRILQGKAIERYSPDYPTIAKQIKVQGEVAVEIIVSTDGRVESARVISGNPVLVQCSVDAARRWRFQPTLLNGSPVKVSGIITFVFKLND
jgi:protein TonB